MSRLSSHNKNNPKVQENISQFHQRVSVVIPLYNHERFIAQTLESVYRQTAIPKEVIIVDDGSQDASLAIARQAVQLHPETIVWSHPNQGAHYTINAGINRASGEFVAILNSDDIYHSERLAQCLPLFDADPQITAVCTGISFIDDNGKMIQNSWYEQARAFYDQIGDLSLALINGNFFMTTSNLIARRSVFDELGYFSNLRYTHDLDFFLRLLLNNKKIYFYDEPLLTYRIHSTNTINEGILKVKVEWAAVVAYFVYNAWWRKKDWKYTSELLKITDHHTLTRLLMIFFAFFQSLPPDKRSCDAFMKDIEFLRFISEEVK
jgi:glycosyltransferase involved in cell wall biosynthesis